MNPDANRALVIRIRDRFFVGFAKDRKVKTAWSLPGARFFGNWEVEEIERIVERLRKAGHVGQIASVVLEGSS